MHSLTFLLSSIALILLTFSICVLIQFFRIHYFLKKTPPPPTPYEQSPSDPQLKILFMGDSLSVGTGALDRRQTVAGRFGKAYPQAQIKNISQNGRKLKDVLEHFPDTKETYDLTIIQVGGNDIIQWSPLKSIKNHLEELLTKTVEITDEIIIMHSGNVGAAPIFIWPFNFLYEKRTLQVREIYIQLSIKYQARYIDLFGGTSDDEFLKNSKTLYSPDLIHPSDEGYKRWFEEIVKQAKVKNLGH